MNSIKLHNNTIDLLRFDESQIRDIKFILQDVLQKDNGFFYANPNYQLTAQESQSFLQKLDALQQGKPLAYILGHQPFWSLDFLVDESTLIPRQDTEYLVEVALKIGDATEKTQDYKNNNKHFAMLDLGTGTGAIAICLKHERTRWQVTATDKMPKAVALAKKNAQRLQTDITFKQGDWFSAIDDNQRFDMIVSNPPYISPNDEHLIHLTHEPITALVATENGLADFNIIISDAKNYLNVGGWLVFEHGYDQAEAVADLFKVAGYINIQTKQDYAHNDRVTMAQLVHIEESET